MRAIVWRHGVSVVAVLVVAAVAGCGAQKTELPTVKGVQKSINAVGGGGLASLSPTMPLDAYQLSTTAEVQLSLAQGLLVERCANRFGYDYPLRSGGSLVDEQVRIQDELGSRLWGISDPAAARRYGYALPPWTEGSTGGGPRLRSRRARIEWGRVMHGTSVGGGTKSSRDVVDGERVPVGGCLGQAQRDLARFHLSEAVTSAQRVAAGLADQAYIEARVSPAVTAVFKRWSACMASHGYDESSPIRFPVSETKLPASQTDIEMAVTDIACKHKTRLLQIADTTMANIEKTLINKHAQVLEQAASQVKSEQARIVKLAAKYDLP